MLKAWITSQHREDFINGTPKPLLMERLLGLPAFGDHSLAAVRLKGPRLMWGRQVMSSSPISPSKTRSGFFKPLLRKVASHALPLSIFWVLVVLAIASPALAQSVPNLSDAIGPAENPEDVTSSIELLLMLTILTLAPSIVIMTTAFTRLIIVFGFLRMALGTQQLPPTQVMTGLALILTFLIMRPTITEIRENALVPYLDTEITQAECFDRSLNSLRNFMFSQVATQDMLMFGRLSGVENPEQEWTTYDEIDTMILVPAFVTSELKRGFYIGFMLYLPFFVIDLMVATVLISMGMLVLPPVLISMPFKLLLFVLVDGWNLVVTALVKSFIPNAPPAGSG